MHLSQPPFGSYDPAMRHKVRTGGRRTVSRRTLTGSVVTTSRSYAYRAPKQPTYRPPRPPKPASRVGPGVVAVFVVACAALVSAGKWFGRVVGVRPWDRRRFLISAWVLAGLESLGLHPWLLGVPFLTLSAIGWLWWRHRRSEAAVPPSPPAAPDGAAWCDWCAAWTDHRMDWAGHDTHATAAR